MKSLKLMVGSIGAFALMLALSENAIATGSQSAPPQVIDQSGSCFNNANCGTQVTTLQNMELDIKVPVSVYNPPPQVILKDGNTTIEGSKSSSALNVEKGAFAPVANGGAGGKAEINLAPGAIAPKAEAVGVQGGVKTGDNHNQVVIDDHSKVKNINVTMVPPGLPSLAPAPVISECANCYIDFLFSAQEISGATTQNVPQVIKGKDIEVAKDVFVTMTSMAQFPGVRKKPGKFGVLPATVNRVPSKDNYQSVAMITVQAKGKDGYMLTPMELQTRALQAAFRLNFPDDVVLYVVFSRKATIEHATVHTTGKGWSIAPGGGGPLGDAIGSITGTIGRSSGTATNDWTPEVTALVIIPMKGGVESGVFNTLDHQATASTSEAKPASSPLVSANQ
jgi:hypothetical protein